MSAENRSGPRRLLHCTVAIRTASGTDFSARSVDVCCGGMSCLLEHPLPTADVCSLAFTVPVGAASKVVTAQACVVYCVCCGMQGFRVGLGFTAVGEGGAEILRRYLAP